MSEHSALIRQLLAAREHWVDIEAGKAVKFRRPLEGEFEGMFRGTPRRFRVLLEDVRRFAIDWRGFTEADLLGKGVGNDDPLPFDAEVWGLAVGDNLDWLQAAAAGLEDILAKRLESRLAARGNSSATSTPSTPAPTVAAAP